tara:strand:- start:1940 stop:2509 length:570 start_codon:yes stop_codon:yes gene_type:complete
MKNIIMILMVAISLTASSQVTDDISFYEIIVKGSLFRPLGWTEPNKKPKYKLIGTRVNDDGSAWAYMSLDGNRYVINALRVGNNIDGTTVKEITTRKVVMENGDIYELPATEFLTRTDKRDKRSSIRSSTTVRSESQVSKREGRTRRQTSNRTGRSRENLRKRWESFQSATPEERERMIKEFRQGRGRK